MKSENEDDIARKKSCDDAANIIISSDEKSKIKQNTASEETIERVVEEKSITTMLQQGDLEEGASTAVSDYATTALPRPGAVRVHGIDHNEDENEDEQVVELNEGRTEQQATTVASRAQQHKRSLVEAKLVPPSEEFSEYSLRQSQLQQQQQLSVDKLPIINAEPISADEQATNTTTTPTVRKGPEDLSIYEIWQRNRMKLSFCFLVLLIIASFIAWMFLDGPMSPDSSDSRDSHDSKD